MKKYIIAMFIAFIGVSAILSPMAHATSLLDYGINLTKEDFAGIVVMKIDRERLFINGDEATGDKPFLEQNRTTVPLRTISEAFGATVD